jgi:hypothetical protein
MYFPYLFGKQRELIAIRELIERIADDDAVRPVVEPVRTDARSLKRTIELCDQHQQPLYVVVNPCESDFRRMDFDQSFAWGRQVFQYEESEWIRPVLLISARTTAANVRAFVNAYRDHEVGIAFRSNTLPFADARALLAVARSSRCFFLGPEPSAATVALFGKERCIWVEDRFPFRERNADYDGRTFFSDRALNWESTGYAGFSDYTVLPPMVRDGGGPPGAVAFHLTHIDLNGGAHDVYVEHFVSDRQDQRERDTDGKFLEALAKYVQALRRRTTSFGLTTAAEEFRERFSRGEPPSLASSKSLQIQHHVELVHGLLTEAYP